MFTFNTTVLSVKKSTKQTRPKEISTKSKCNNIPIRPFLINYRKFWKFLKT